MSYAQYSELKRTLSDPSQFKIDSEIHDGTDSHYIDDNSFQEHYQKSVGASNPVYDSLKDIKEPEHAYHYINVFKTCELYIGPFSQAPLNLTSSEWGSWRGRVVSPKVLLWPDEKEFSFSFSNKYGQAWEKMSSSGLLGKVQSGLELMRSVAGALGNSNTAVGGKFVSAYIKAPTWESTDPIQLTNSLSFTFNFGQAGIFSGEEEVVRPILQLASQFAPRRAEGKDNYYIGNFPTPPEVMTHYWSTMSDNIFKDVKNAMSATSSSGDSEDTGFLSQLTNTLTSYEDTLISRQTQAIEDAYKQNTRCLYVRYGRMTLGPYIVKDVNWSFDQSQLDEYGFPYKGKITFSGLESIRMPEQNQIPSMVQ